MSFREKSDWVSFVTLCFFVVYFWEVAKGFGSGVPSSNPFFYFTLFWVLVGLQVVVQIGSMVLLAVRFPKEAQTPLDERERLIRLRATRVAYFVLLVGAFLSIGVMHMNFSTWQFAHCILLVIWLAELLHYGLRLYHYRRQA